jgi:hypothetical protein
LAYIRHAKTRTTGLYKDAREAKDTEEERQVKNLKGAS